MGLVNLDGAAQHDPVLVAGYRGKHAVPPLEGRLVGDAAQLGRALDGDVVAHEPDEGDPGGERLAAVLQDGAGEGGEPPAAAAAAPPRDAGSDGAAPPDRIARSRSSQGLSRCLTGVHHGDAGEASNHNHAGLALSSSALFKLINTGYFTPLCNKF